MKKVTLIEPVGGHGGMDFYDYGLAIGLSKNNCKVFYCTSNKTVEKKIENVKTLYHFGDIWDKSKIKKLILFFKGYWKSFMFSKKNKIKNVHFQFFDFFIPNTVVVLFSFLFRFNRILTIHDIDSFKGKNYDFYLRIICFLVNQIIVHNNESRNALIQKGVSIDKIFVIPHGNYLPFVDELEYNPSDGRLKLLFFGQIKKVKGLNVLLEAFKIALNQTKNIQLTIAGKAWHDEINQYEDFILNNNLQNNVITKFEYIPNENVVDYFNDADIVVLPYLKIYQSGVLLLTMSYGRPVIASNLKAFTDIIENQKSGFIFETENCENLANLIIYIEKNRNKLIDVRNNGSKIIKDEYDWIKIGEKTINLYI